MFELALSVIIVIVVSALCSLFEAVLYSVPTSHIEALVQARRPAGAVLQKLREKVDAPIAAILSLNTIANTAGAAIAGALAARVLDSVWVGLFSALFTLAILFFSEIMPKTVGVVYARPLSSWVAQPLQILVWLFRPFIWLMGLATRAVGGKGARESVSEAELLVMTQLGIKSGAIKEDQGLVIKNILSLEDRVAREVMTPRPVIFALPDNISVEEASKHERIFFHSRIPVYAEDQENVVGVVHRQDIFQALAEDRPEAELKSLMQPVHFVFERTTLDQVLKKFLELRRHIFMVVGEFGDIIGLITLEDVLEEILGKEIVDESDLVIDMRELAERRREQLLRENSESFPVGKKKQ
jgi:CBS domain containing-hemolysin-like protein